MSSAIKIPGKEELEVRIINSILHDHRQLAFSSGNPQTPISGEQSRHVGLSLKTSYEESGPPTPITGPPWNFGEVGPGIYRSSFPRATNFEHLQSLGLRTILTLVPEPYPLDYVEFIVSTGVKQVIVPLPAHKDESDSIPAESMRKVLEVLVDPSQHPVLVHCNKGKHRTGCVIACYRKVLKWAPQKVIDEYRQFAGDKARALDEKYIERFDAAGLVQLQADEDQKSESL